MSSVLNNRTIVILAFQSEVVSDVYSLAFEGVFGSRIISCGDIAAANEALRQNPDACVIVEASKSPADLTSLFERQTALARRSLIFVLGGDPKTYPLSTSNQHVEFLPSVPDIKELVDKMESTLQLESGTKQFCKIPLRSLLVRGKKLHCDIYIQLSDEKFVKVLNSNERFDREEYERFKAKGVKSLYLARADFLDLVNDLLSQVNGFTSNPDKINLEESLSTSLAIFETVHSAFETEGFTPSLQKLTLATVDVAIKTIRKDPKLSELLERLNKNRDSYICWNSTALNFLCCKLATLLDWQSEATFFKLSLASLVHDLTLPKDDMALIRTLDELDKSQFSEEEKTLIKRHPIDASRLLDGFDEVPGEVGFIVEQHHERQDGSGFPNGIDHREISLVSALFIIAQDIVHEMFTLPEGGFQMNEFMKKRKAEQVYTKGTFGQVFRSIEAKLAES